MKLHLKLATGIASLVAFSLAHTTAIAAEAGAWDGFYAGAQIGGREQKSEWQQKGIYTPTDPVTYLGELDIDHTGMDDYGYVGLYGGRNWPLTDKIVVGAELAVGYGNNETSGNYVDFTGGIFPSGTEITVKSDWDASLRGRAGYLVTPTVLFYGTAGVAATRLETSIHCPAAEGYVCNPASPDRKENHDKTMLGWTAGFGVEASLISNLVARAEYQYSDYGSTSFWAMHPEAGEAFGVKSKVDLTTQKLILGLAYRF